MKMDASDKEASKGQRPLDRRAAYIQEVNSILTVLALVDQLASRNGLDWGEFHSSPNFTTGAVLLSLQRESAPRSGPFPSRPETIICHMQS